MSGISGASLSGWFASYHQLLSTVPPDFTPIARGFQTGEWVDDVDENGDPVLVAVEVDPPVPMPVIVVRP